MARETNIAWPEDTLGCPLRADYGKGAEAEFVRTEVADGPARYRRVKVSQRQEIRVSFMWTTDQLDTWDRFLATTLQGGLRWFTMNQVTGRGIQPMYCHLMPGGVETGMQRDRLDRVMVNFTIEAFDTPESAPQPGISNIPVDGGTAAAPASTGNTWDGKWNVETRPLDINDSLTPGLVF